MKRNEIFMRAVFALVGAVCFSLGVLANETPRLENVLVVNNDVWRTDLAVVAPDGPAIARISDCKGFGGDELNATLANGAGVLIRDVAQYQCSATQLGVVKLPVLAGEPRLWTQASYRDAVGNRNVVNLPPLPAPLERSYSLPTNGFSAEYVFDGIENGSALGKSTFIALIPDGEGKTQVELSVYSYTNPAAAVTETIVIDGFTFYELTTPVEFGRVVVKHVAPARLAGPEPRLFAVAFIGDREAGSPRVEVPRTRFTVYSE